MGFILRGEEVSRGVSDQGVRGGGKPRDVVLQALPCGLSPGAPGVSSCRWLWEAIRWFPVATRRAAFWMVCRRLTLVSEATVDQTGAAYSRRGLTKALKVTSSVSVS